MKSYRLIIVYNRKGKEYVVYTTTIVNTSNKTNGKNKNITSVYLFFLNTSTTARLVPIYTSYNTH